MNWLSLRTQRKNGRIRPLAAQQNMKMATFYSAVVPVDFKMDMQFFYLSCYHIIELLHV